MIPVDADIHGFVLRLAASLGVVVAYYYAMKRVLFALTRTVVKRCWRGTRWPFANVIGVAELSVAATSHALLVGILVLVTGVRHRQLVGAFSGPAGLWFGVGLGISEMALASFLCRLLMGGIGACSPASAPADLEEWLVVARGGWMRRHFKTIEVAPWPLILLLIPLQISAEEIMFRVVLMQFFGGFGAACAITVSCILFVIMQSFLMPSWMGAMFPMVGGLVMGVTHGVLIWHVPDVTPLAVAHLTFFLVAVL